MINNRLLEEIGKNTGYEIDIYDDVDPVIEKIFRNLPHGSGLDDSYYLSVNKNTYVIHGSFHQMNNGFYSGWSDFRLLIDPHDPKDFKLQFAKYSYHSAIRYDLREYLEDTLYRNIQETLRG